MNNLFSKERINTGRQLELDLVKAVAIVMMIWIHTYEELSNGFEPSLSAINAYLIGSIGVATTFMFCMGIGLSYTRHNSAVEFLRRGARLLTYGFALFLFRDILPTLLSSWIYKWHEYLAYLILGFSGDIFQFAGLAFLFVGCLKRLKIGYVGMLIISIALSIIGTLLEGISTGCYPVDQILGFFWGTESESYFPFFNWFIFVAAGQWFGDKYQFLQDKKRFHAISLLVGTILCAAYIYVSFNVEQNIFKGLTSERYLAHRPISDAIVCLLINVGLISLFYFIWKLIPRKSIPVIIHPSIHTSQYFCISWVIIQSILYLYPKLSELDNDAQVITAWICIFAATILAVIIYTKYLEERTEAFFGKHRVFWTVFVWAACIASFILAICLFDSRPNFMNGYDIGI